MGIAVSASEQAALRLLCELAPKYDCKLKEKEAAAICQWARRRGHIKHLKDAFWKQTWKNVGADMWGAIQNGHPEAQKLAPIYGTLSKIMTGLHGEVEAKRALQKALGVDWEEEEEGDRRDPWPPPHQDPGEDLPEEAEMYPLTEAEKSAMGGPSDNLLHLAERKQLFTLDAWEKLEKDLWEAVQGKNKKARAVATPYQKLYRVLQAVYSQAQSCPIRTNMAKAAKAAEEGQHTELRDRLKQWKKRKKKARK